MTPPEDDDIITGTEALRRRLRARSAHGPVYIGQLARDLHIDPGRLDDFARRGTGLPDLTLQALARALCDADFDAERDLLVARPRPEPTVLGAARPPSIAEQVAAGALTLPKSFGPGIRPPPPAPSLAKGALSKPPGPRPGFAR